MRGPATQHDAGQPVGARRRCRDMSGSAHASRGCTDRGSGTHAILLLAAGMAMLLTASSAAAAGRGDLLAVGNESGLWLIRQSGERTFDLALRQVGMPWTLVLRDYPRTVQAAAAVNGQIHLILAGPSSHLIVHPGDQEPLEALQPRDEHWPAGAPVLSAFELTDPNRLRAPSLVVVVAAPEPPPTRPASASGPAARPAPRGVSAHAGKLDLHVMHYAQGRWELLAVYSGARIGPQTRVFGAAAEGAVYLYVVGAVSQPDRLLKWDGLQWHELPGLPAPSAVPAASAPADTMPADASSASSSSSGPAAATKLAPSREVAPPTSHVFAMTALGRQPVLLRAVPAAPQGPSTSQPARWRIQLASFDPATSAFAIQDVRTLDQSAPWSVIDFPSNPPLAARLGDQIALFWKRQGRIQMGTADMTGTFLPQEEVEVFEPQTTSAQGEDLRTYFVLGALILSAMLAFYLRSRVPLRPFTLPPGVAPADPFRRLLAGIIDLAPILMLARAFVRVPLMSPAQLFRMFQEQRAPLGIYYAMVGGVAFYVVYCIVLEHRFGMTLGKAILKMRVSNDHGARATLPQLALRNILKIAELLWGPAGIPILLLMPLLNRNRQRLGDLFARTVVVTGRPTEQPTKPDRTEHDTDQDG